MYTSFSLPLPPNKLYSKNISGMLHPNTIPTLDIMKNKEGIHTSIPISPQLHCTKNHSLPIS